MNRADANRLLDRVKAGQIQASERTITLALCLTGDLPKPWHFPERPLLPPITTRTVKEPA